MYVDSGTYIKADFQECVLQNVVNKLALVTYNDYVVIIRVAIIITTYVCECFIENVITLNC